MHECTNTHLDTEEPDLVVTAGRFMDNKAVEVRYEVSNQLLIPSYHGAVLTTSFPSSHPLLGGPGFGRFA